MTPHVVRRLTKLVERALDPDGGAEAHNALDAVHRWMKRNRKDPEELLASLFRAAPTYMAPLSGDWVEQIEWLDTKHLYLNDRELDFVISLRRQVEAKHKQWVPSMKQQGRLRAIYTAVKMVAYQQ